MRPRTILLLVWIAGVALIFALAVREHLGTARTYAKLAAAQQTRLEALRRTAVRRAALAEQECEALQNTLENGAGNATAGAPEQKFTPRTTGLPDLLKADPQLQNLQGEFERSRLAELYAPFCHARLLSPDQIARVHGILMKRTERSMDPAAAVAWLGASGGTGARPERQTADNLRQEMTGLLGEAGWVAFTEYERTLPAWQLVNKFAGNVALEGAPLSAEQAADLAQVVASASPEYRSGGIADLDTVDWNIATSAAADLLTEPQALAFANSAPRYPVREPPKEPSGTNLNPPLPPGP